MRIASTDIPVRIDAPGATARQQTGFGDVSGYTTMGAERFSFDAGADITALLEGLDGDCCHCPHWGYVIKGAITAMYTEGELKGTEETCRQGDIFYWPPGHSVRAEEDTDIVMFSPEHEHGQVMDHIQEKLG
ncbi:MAG: hypothetical protein RIE32_01870 [Phycisphaerales bacterium]